MADGAGVATINLAACDAKIGHIMVKMAPVLIKAGTGYLRVTQRLCADNGVEFTVTGMRFVKLPGAIDENTQRFLKCGSRLHRCSHAMLDLLLNFLMHAEEQISLVFEIVIDRARCHSRFLRNHAI